MPASQSSSTAAQPTALRFAATALVLFAACDVRAAEPSAGELAGRVTDEQGKPVAGVLVIVKVIPGGFVPDDVALRRGRTSTDGRYAIELPLGHALGMPPQSPGGYFGEGARMTPFATSREAPVHTLDFALRRGMKWSVSLDDVLKRTAKMISVRGQGKMPFTFLSQPFEGGQADVTLPPTGGAFDLFVIDQTYQALAKFKVEAPPEFDPQHVVQVGDADETGAFHVVDAKGRRARVVGAKPDVADGELVLHPPPARAGVASRTVRISGSVANDQGQPLPDAEVRLGLASAGGSNSTLTAVRTAADGRFSFDAEMPPDEPANSRRSLFLIVTRDGHAGVITAEKRVSTAQQSMEFSPIRLGLGHSIRVRLIDAAGKPLVGAWVEPGNSYLSFANATKTDHEGRCELRNLPADVVPISASFGTLAYRSKIVVGSSPGADEEVTLTLGESSQQVAPSEPFPKPPALGTIAPEWTVVGWTDGKQRKLSEFRGKVVVLDFWGVWCSACMNAVPSIKQLEAKYADRSDIVFFGIHSAGTDMDQVKRLQRLKNWTLVTGFDQGSDVGEGATARAYGASGWPTVVIIDRQGKIAYNSNLEEWTALSVLRENMRIAKAMGLPPEKPDASADERLERMNAINVFRESGLIDRVLESK